MPLAQYVAYPPSSTQCLFGLVGGTQIWNMLPDTSLKAIAKNTWFREGLHKHSLKVPELQRQSPSWKASHEIPQFYEIWLFIPVVRN